MASQNKINPMASQTCQSIFMFYSISNIRSLYFLKPPEICATYFENFKGYIYSTVH